MSASFETAAQIIERSFKLLVSILTAITDTVVMTPEPTYVLFAVSTVSATIFLLILPVRLWELHNLSISRTLTWKGLFKAISIPALQDSRSISYKNIDCRLLGYYY